MSKEIPEVKEVIDLTSEPEPPAHPRKWRQAPGIVDLTQKVKSTSEHWESPPYKRPRTTDTAGGRSRVLDALDEFDWEASKAGPSMSVSEKKTDANCSGGRSEEWNEIIDVSD